jgi:hypothetical protein
MPIPLVWAPVVILLAIPASAQRTPSLRSKALGEVRTTDGKAWVGAEVTLVSLPIPDLPRVGEIDRVTTTTDARGRFRVPVLRNRRYSVWATAGRRVSMALEGVVAGQPALLTESTTIPEQVFELRGLDAWKAYAPLRVELIVATETGQVIPIALDANHRFLLPTVPGPTCRLEVLDKDGLVRHRANIQLPKQKNDEPIALAMSQPKLEYLAVRDIKTEKGLPGATISIMHHGALTPIGKTDADGLAHLAIPHKPVAYGAALFAAAPGHAVAGFQNGDAKQVKSGKWKPLRDVKVARHTNLNAGLRFKGRIMLDKNRPAANVSLVVRGQGMHFSSKNNRSVGVYRRVLRTDQDGRFELSSCLPESHWRSEIFAVLNPDVIAALPKPWHRQFQPRIQDLFALDKGGLDQVNDLGVFDLSTLCPVRFSVIDHSGQPAAFASVSLSRRASPNREVIPIGESRADRMGRALFLIRADDETIVVAKYQGAIALHRVDVERRAGDETIADVVIKLSAKWSVSGRIVDAKGNPVASVTIRLTPNTRGGLAGRIVRPAVPDDAPTPGSTRNAAHLKNLGDAGLAGRILHSAFGRQLRAQTDAKGNFRFDVPPHAMEYRVYGSGKGRSLRSSISVDDGPVKDLQFELR